MVAIKTNTMDIKDLEKENYITPIYIPDVGWCALFRFMFTTGVVYNIDDNGYEGRYCFKHHNDAKKALLDFNNIEHNKDWIKHKGNREYSNPLYEE